MRKSLPPLTPVLALFASLLGPWRGRCSCPADQAASLLPGIAPEEFAWEVRAENGDIVPLTQQDVAWAALGVGLSQQHDCWYMHWGFTGSFTRRCDAGGTVADMSSCLRTGCVWHRYVLQQTAAAYLVTQGAEIDASGPSSTGLWGSMVLANSGALYAAPMSAASILRIDTAGSASRLLVGPDLGVSTTKYSGIVQGPDGTVYAIPYSAPQVLRINPTTDEVSAVGNNFQESYKWSHGVLAHDGHIYGIPSFASAVLRLSPTTGDTSMLPGVIDSGIMKWVYGVVAPNGLVFGIPGNARSVLRIDPNRGEASSFGHFGTQARKWAHGLVGVDGHIYGVPSSATAVLRIDPVGSVATATLGQGLPQDDFKWSMGVATADGRIYCIPRASQQVLRIDPLARTIDLFGSLSSFKWKWQYGILAPDGFIYAIPSSASHVLRIDPSASIAEEIGPDLGLTTQKYDAASLAPSGAIYAAPSSVSRVLQIGAEAEVCTKPPLGQIITCTLGLLCEVVLTSVAGRRSSLNSAQLLWISSAQGRCSDKGNLVVRGFVNPQGISSDLGNGSWQFTIGIGNEGVSTFTYGLCWSPTPTSRETITLGSFQLHGPEQQLVHCTLGIPCNVGLQGNGFSSGSALSLVPIGVPCGSTPPQAIAGFTIPRILNGTSVLSDSHVVHDLGTSLDGPAGVYLMCWAQGSAGAASSGSEYTVHAGELRLVGPLLPGNPIECFAGALCAVSLKGTDLSVSNRLSVREDCENGPHVGIAGIVSEASPGGDGGTFLLGTPSEGGRRVLVLCWQSHVSAPYVLYSSFHMYGPLDGGIAVQCILGKPCNFTIQDDFLYGASVILSMWNRLLVVAGAESACPGQGMPIWSGASNPSRPVENASFYTLGSPNALTYTSSQAFVGDHTLCLSLDGQPNTFFMDIGSLKINDTECLVPEALHGHGVDPSCVSSDRDQQHVTSLGNAESCVPRCAEFYSASTQALSCYYGRLEPPFYECRKKCLMAPSVPYGEDHSHCINFAHGAQCALRCQPGTVKSGDLECQHGRWVHRPTLPHELLFDVPRCYRKCNAQEVGCATMGSGQLSHGDVCRAVCPRGFTPSISEVRCSDGIAEPRSFECRENCVSPPQIAHSSGMEYCANSANGARCFLRCKEGYAKSGDPTCENGVWTKERCLAPCAGPSVTNAATIPCDGLEFVEHGSHCSPVCQEGFSPVVEVGNESVVSDSSGPHLQCNDGVLSPPSFSCLASCMEKPNVEYADKDLLLICQGTPHGSACQTPCLPGYIKTRDLECSDGIFGAAVCLKKCDDPPQVEFATKNYACVNQPPGAICATYCYEGFLPTGSAVCDNGKWSSEQCLQVCSAPNDVAHSIWPPCAEGDIIASGGTCTHQCVEGFTPSPTQSLCTNGKLQSETFECERFCGNPPDVPNVVDLSHCESYQIDEKCEFLCRAGFHPVGRWHCTIDGWRQHRGTMLAGALTLRHAHSLGEIETGREFQLSFEIELLSAAGRHYQSVLHFTKTGHNCCEVGDRVPAVLLSPSLDGRTGRELNVFMDPGPHCFLQDPLPRVGVRAKVVITFVGKVLQVTIDGRVACTASYSTEVEPQTGVTVYGASPWYEQADALLRDVAYDHMSVGSTKPKCEPVFCQDSPPPVPGASVEEDGLPFKSPCVGAAFNAVCQDTRCPDGTRSQGRFLCGHEGIWIPENGVTVECIPVLCPEMLPFVPQTGVRTFCNYREFGDLCVVTCAIGYSNSGTFVCGIDGTWAEVPGNPVACTALPCLTPPSIMNGAGRQICNDLPSGMLCEAECNEGSKAVGEFRCDAQLWVDAPLCAQDSLLESAKSGPNQAIVKGGFSVEPSSDIQDVIPAVQFWSTSIKRAFSSGMEKYLAKQLAEPATVGILAYVGYGSGGGDRQLQEVRPEDSDETNARPRGWRADLVYIVVPGSNSHADAQAIYAILAALSVDEIATLMMEALSPPLPESLNVRFSEPRLAELSTDIVAELPTLLTEERTTTTYEPDQLTTGSNFLVPVTSNGTTSGPTSNFDSSFVIFEEDEDDDSPSGTYKVLLYVCIGIAACMSCLIFYRFLSYTRRHKEDADSLEIHDREYCIEHFGDEQVSDGVDFKKMEKYKAVQASIDRVEYLRATLHGAAQGSRPGKAPDVASLPAREDPSTSHWDIHNAPKHKQKDNRLARQMKTLEGTQAMDYINRHKHRDRPLYGCCKNIKRFCYIMLYGRRIQRDIERKRAAREGRQPRFGPQQESKSPRKSLKDACRPSEEWMGKTLSNAGLPKFVIDALQQHSSDIPEAQSSMQVGEAALETTSTEQTASERSTSSKANSPKLNSPKPGSPKLNSPKPGSPKFGGSAGSARSVPASVSSSRSPVPRNSETQVEIRRLSFRSQQSKNSEADQSLSLAEVQKMRDMTVSLSLEDIQKMSPEEYDMYTENVIENMFEFAGVDNIAVKGDPIVPFWDPRTQQQLKAKELKYNTTSAEAPDPKKAGTHEKVLKDTSLDYEKKEITETRTTRYAKPTRRIFDEDYKKECEQAATAGSQVGVSDLSNYSGSGSSEQEEEEEEDDPTHPDLSQGIADKLETHDVVSDSSGELGPDAEFSVEDDDLEVDAVAASPTSHRSDRRTVTGGGAARMDTWRMDSLVERRDSPDKRKHARNASDGEVKLPTNPNVIKAIQAAKQSEKYLSANPDDRAEAAKMYMGIETGEDRGGWFGVGEVGAGATSYFGAGFNRFFGRGSKAEEVS